MSAARPLSFGDRFNSKLGLGFWVVERTKSDHVLIEFDASKSRLITEAGQIRNGSVKDKMHGAVCGVGYVGIGSHKAFIGGNSTKAYTVWGSMLERCYSVKTQNRNPTYKNCIVCDEWHNFQNFAEWFYKNHKEGLQIDKDIKGDGKLYSPKTCCFVTNQVNCEKASAKLYILINPKGRRVEIYNMAKFCRDNNLHRGSMTYVISGKINHHKGWRAESLAAGLKDGTVVL